MWPRALVLTLAGLALAACGTNAPQPDVETQAAPPTEQETQAVEPTSTPAPTATDEPTPTSTPEAQGAVFEAAAEVVREHATDPARVEGTLTELLNVPVEGGQAVVFHYEDVFAGVVIGCTCHAVASDQNGWQLRLLNRFCGDPTGPGTPISVGISRGAEEGEYYAFGEIYDEAVVGVEVDFEDGASLAAQVGEAAYQAGPAASLPVTARALDEAGEVVYQALISPPGS
jgi:hypothetical protein